MASPKKSIAQRVFEGLRVSAHAVWSRMTNGRCQGSCQDESWFDDTEIARLFEAGTIANIHHSDIFELHFKDSTSIIVTSSSIMVKLNDGITIADMVRASFKPRELWIIFEAIAGNAKHLLHGLVTMLIEHGLSPLTRPLVATLENSFCCTLGTARIFVFRDGSWVRFTADQYFED